MFQIEGVPTKLQHRHTGAKIRILSKKITYLKKDLNFHKSHILKNWILKSHIARNSHFQILIFDKIHQLQILIFRKIQIEETSNSSDFFDK